MIDAFWPNVGHYLRHEVSRNGFRNFPEIRNVLDLYGIGDITFEKIALGHVPPRVTGIKVYDKKSTRNQIILDVDLLYASDCDIKLYLMGLSSGIKNIYFRGSLRLEFKPLITDLPLFERLNGYFLTPPEIDFEFCGLANILDAAGISTILRSILVELIGVYTVFPNKLNIWSLDSNKCKH